MTLEIAYSIYQSHRTQRAVEAYTELIDDQIDTSKAYEGRALCYQTLLRTDLAFVDFAKAIEADATNDNAFYLRGMLHAEMEDFEQAEIDVKKAIALYGHSTEYELNLAFIYVQRKKYDNAIVLIEDCLGYNPDNPYALGLIADAYLFLPDYEKAISYYTKLRKVEEWDALILNNVGFALLNLDQPEQALTHLNAAAVIDPYFAYAYANRGYCFHLIGKTTRGEADLVRALQLDPSNAYAYRYLGLIAKHQSKFNLAAQHFQTALQLGYTEEYGDEVSTLLKSLPK